MGTDLSGKPMDLVLGFSASTAFNFLDKLATFSSSKCNNTSIFLLPKLIDVLAINVTGYVYGQ